MIIHENQLTAAEFCALTKSVGWDTPGPEQAEIALENSLYRVSAKIDGKIVGMGRVIGDMARWFYITDIVIDPNYQGMGLGSTVVEKLLSFIESLPIENCNVMVGVMSAKGKEGFYEKLGFEPRPNDSLGCGMMMYIKK